MRILDKSGRVFCQIQTSGPVGQPTTFPPVVSYSGKKYHFEEKSTYFNKNTFIVFVCTFPKEEWEAFEKANTLSPDKLFCHSRKMKVCKNEESDETHYYAGFSGLHKTHLAIKQFLAQYQHLRENNADAFAQLEEMSAQLQSRMQKRAKPNAILTSQLEATSDKAIFDKKESGEIVRYPTVRIKGDKSSTAYIQKTLGTHSVSSRNVEVEAFASMLFRFISVNRNPLVMPFYNEQHERVGVLSEKIRDFESVGKFLKRHDRQGGKKGFQDALTSFLRTYNEDIPPLSVATYAIGGGDWHPDNWGFEGMENAHVRRLFRIDTEKIEPLTAKYANFDPDKPRQVHDGKQLSPKKSYPITHGDIRHHPKLSDTYFDHWLDERKTKTFEFIESSEKLGLNFDAKYFYFLLVVLMPRMFIERLGDKLFTSEKAKIKYVDHIWKRFREIEKILVTVPEFQLYLLRHRHLLKHVQAAVAKFNEGIANTYYDDSQVSDDEQTEMAHHFKFLQSGAFISSALVHYNVKFKIDTHDLSKQFPAQSTEMFVSGLSQLIAKLPELLTSLTSYAENDLVDEVNGTLAFLTEVGNYIKHGHLRCCPRYDATQANGALAHARDVLSSKTMQAKFFCIGVKKHLEGTKWPLKKAESKLLKSLNEETKADNGNPLSGEQYRQYQVVKRALAEELTFESARQQVMQIGIESKAEQGKWSKTWLFRSAPVVSYFKQFDADDASQLTRTLGLPNLTPH